MTLLRQLETVTSVKSSLMRLIRSKFPKVSRELEAGVDEVGVGGCRAEDMLGCNVDARRGLGIENNDADVGVVGRLRRQDKRRFMQWPSDTKAGLCVLKAQFTIRESHSFTLHAIVTNRESRNSTRVMSSGPSTPTAEQLALRDARRLKKLQAKAEARAASLKAPPPPLVNLEKGQIVPRSWLTVQDDHQTASRPVRIMTWNVRNRLLLLFYS